MMQLHQLSAAPALQLAKRILLQVFLPPVAAGHIEHRLAGLITLTLWQRTSRWTLQSPCCRPTPCCTSPGRSCRIRSVPLCSLWWFLLHSVGPTLLHPWRTSCRALCTAGSVCVMRYELGTISSNLNADCTSSGHG